MNCEATDINSKPPMVRRNATTGWATMVAQNDAIPYQFRDMFV
jgi:hypothetical protein